MPWWITGIQLRIGALTPGNLRKYALPQPVHTPDQPIPCNQKSSANVLPRWAPGMQARDPEHIITIASAASIVTMPGEASCAANKHDVLGYLRAVREELRRSPVQISVITQSVVNTALAAGTATGTAKLLTPETIAESVLRTIERPRF